MIAPVIRIRNCHSNQLPPAALGRDTTLGAVILTDTALYAEHAGTPRVLP